MQLVISAHIQWEENLEWGKCSDGQNGQIFSRASFRIKYKCIIRAKPLNVHVLTGGGKLSVPGFYMSVSVGTQLHKNPNIYVS